MFYGIFLKYSSLISCNRHWKWIEVAFQINNSRAMQFTTTAFHLELIESENLIHRGLFPFKIANVLTISRHSVRDKHCVGLILYCKVLKKCVCTFAYVRQTKETLSRMFSRSFSIIIALFLVSFNKHLIHEK